MDKVSIVAVVLPILAIIVVIGLTIWLFMPGESQPMSIDNFIPGMGEIYIRPE